MNYILIYTDENNTPQKVYSSDLEQLTIKLNACMTAGIEATIYKLIQIVSYEGIK